jgi:hypothetical protein
MIMVMTTDPKSPTPETISPPALPSPTPSVPPSGVKVPLLVRLYAGDVEVAISSEHDLWRAVLRVIVEGGLLLQEGDPENVDVSQ